MANANLTMLPIMVENRIKKDKMMGCKMMGSKLKNCKIKEHYNGGKLKWWNVKIVE